MSRRAFKSKFSKNHWKRASKKKGLFGGKIVSSDEIALMDERNALAEEIDFKSFEADLDAELQEL
jgi:hypothetical protein